MSVKDWWHKEGPHIRLLLVGMLALCLWAVYRLYPEHPLFAVFCAAWALVIAVGLYLYW